MSSNRRFALGVGAAIAISGALAAILSEHFAGRSQDVATAPTVATSTSQQPGLHPVHRRSWRAEANAVCMLGHQLYPSIALGAAADLDTMDYAVERLVAEIAAVPSSPSSLPVLRLTQRGKAAAGLWRSLATRMSNDVTARERRDAERLTAAYVDQLVALGADACAPLRPQTT